jgi:O-antigen ligase
MTAFVQTASRAGERLACVCLIALGFSIPVSTALDNVLIALFVAGWLLSGRLRHVAAALRSNPVALMAIVWFAAHAVGALYSIGEARDVARALAKAATFLLVPLAVTVLTEPRDRERALYAFMAALALTVVLSWARWGGVLPADAPLLKSTVTSAAVVFKYHLTQNFLLAIGAFFFAVAASRASSPALRVLLWSFCALAIVNVVMIGDGRTGQVVLAVLCLHYAVWRWGARGIMAGAAFVLALGAVGYLVPESALHQRAARAISEARDWRADGADPQGTSVGLRLEYYRESVRMLPERPLAGVGTGGFPTAYAQHVQGTRLVPTRNPHSEYLLKAVELGVSGLVLILALWWVHWRSAARLDSAHHAALARGLVLAYALASIATTTLSDHAEGLLFVWAGAILYSALQPAGVHTHAPLRPSGVAHPSAR